MELTPRRHPHSVSRPCAFPLHWKKKSCFQYKSWTAPAHPPGACLWTVWLDLTMERLVFYDWLFKICDRNLCLEHISNAARWNQGTGPMHCKKKKKSFHLTNALRWASAAVNQGACQTSLVTTQAKPAGSRWHMLIVIPDDYLHKNKSNACCPYQDSHTHVSRTLLTLIIV